MKITVKDLIYMRSEFDLELTSLTDETGFGKEIIFADINRPGLCLAGAFEHFAHDRIQIFGKGESSYFNNLSSDVRKKVMKEFFSFDVFCCIFSHGVRPPSDFIETAIEKKVPVLVSPLSTADLIDILTRKIRNSLLPVVNVHGTLVDVFGFGVLLLGKSGIGKSETALELIERGHRLIADDIVEIKKLDENTIAGTGSHLIRHHIEIRGLGILNIRDIYGIRSVRNRKKIELIVSLEEWNYMADYDRSGIDENFYEIIGVKVPHVLLPVRLGRNIPIIVETAALNQRLKKMGVHSARELDAKIQNWMRMEKQ